MPAPDREHALAQWLVLRVWGLPLSLDSFQVETRARFLAYARDLLDWEMQQGWIK